MTDGRLSGALADGSDIETDVSLREDGQVLLHNIPEPSTFIIWSLLGAPALFTYAWRRRRWR